MARWSVKFFFIQKNNKKTISFTYFISKGCDIGEPIPRKTELAGNHSWIGQISHRFAFYLYRNNVLSCTKWELYTKAIGRLFRTVNEQRHDKTNKMSMRPAKTQISLSINPGWSESSLSTWRKLGSLATHLSAQWRLWSAWADAKADLSLHCACPHFVGFVMSWLKLRFIAYFWL